MNDRALDLDGLLARTSRTFAASIPLLDEPLRRQVGVAYLLFRIADTFEDAAAWPRARRIEALEQFRRVLEGEAEPSRALVEHWCGDGTLSESRGYVELVEQTAAVVAAARALGAAQWRAIRRHTVRTVEGMARIVARAEPNGDLRLEDLEALRRYCYVVAGIVGELLTDLFVLGHPPLDAAREGLDERAPRFGEGLQLTNILKDRGDDAAAGRVFLPPDTERAEVFALARRDLEAAREYVEILRREDAPPGYQRFTALPLLLARATLDVVEEQGPGAKVPRELVLETVVRVREGVADGRSVV